MEEFMPSANSAELKTYCSVILDEKFPKTLDYSIPSSMQSFLSLGARVEVPIKNQARKGYVIALKKEPSFSPVKPILGVLPKDLWLPEELFSLAKWMVQYYGSSFSQTLHAMIPTSVRKEVTPPKKLFLTLKKSRKETVKQIALFREKFPQRALVLELLLKQKKGIFLSEIQKKLKISRSPIDALIKEKALLSSKQIEAEEDFLSDLDFFPTEAKSLHEEQKQALEKIQNSLQKQAFQVHLLYGVTGSGKTEVYLQAIQTALDLGKSALLLVPEIALTVQLIEKLRARFQKPISVFHSKKSLGERYQNWMQVKREDRHILLGARSAVFAPAKHLGLIIVDEEHDGSYKQTEEQPTYHARDIAVIRGKMQGCTVILGSATPSLESIYNAEKNKYHLSQLSKRATQQSLPKVFIVDQKKEWQQAGGFTHFSKLLLEKMQLRAKLGEQTLLFLNKRGYYSVKICKACLQPHKCPHCALSLTFHKKADILLCHLCGYRTSPLQTCIHCKSPLGEFKGFGTQHVEACLKALLPDLRILRMDRDTMQNKHSHETTFSSFRSGKADVLIGTQMIAKGFHFPQVTLVGVLYPDFLLNLPDFRSSEILFQLLTQVSGRAGREDMEGEVVIQTFHPQHPIIQLSAKGDFFTFYQQEMGQRKKWGYPPFQRIIRLIFSGKKEESVQQKAEAFLQKLQQKLPPTIKAYPVVACGYAKIKDRFRFHSLLFTPQIKGVIDPIVRLKQSFASSSFSIFIDVDPTYTYF